MFLRSRWQWILWSTIISLVTPVVIFAEETKATSTPPLVASPGLKKKKIRKQAKQPVVQDVVVATTDSNTDNQDSTFSVSETSQPTSQDSSTTGDSSVYVGMYAFKGLEAGVMGSLKLMELPSLDATTKTIISGEIGLHRARWIYQHSEYNRFAATGDVRLDLKISPLMTPYIAAGVGYQREWYRGSDTALTDTPLNLRAGAFIPVTDSVLLRMEIAPALSSLRLGLALPF